MERVAQTQVAIVGAGPVGLALALGLARQGIRSVVVEQDEGLSEQSKAAGVHVRTREVLRQWGVEAAFLEAGVLVDRLALHDVRGDRTLWELDFRLLEAEAERPGLLMLEQSRTERLLLEAVRASGLCEVWFQAEAVGLAQGETGVRLTVRTPSGDRGLAAAYAVGCDGATSFVREALGLSFDGGTYGVRPMLADVRVEDGRDALPWPRVFNGPGAYAFALRLRPGLWRLVALTRRPPDAEEVQPAEIARFGEVLLGPGPLQTVWASRFRIHVRSAPRFRAGRVLLAGDAAHVHSPATGLGMNGGIHDAHNLAWKLASVLRGGDAERLLSSYDEERRAVMVETVSPYTDWLTRLFLDVPQVVRAMGFGLVRRLMRSERARRRALRRTAMLDLDYPRSALLPDLPAAGMRLPDVLLQGPDGRVRLYERLSYAPVLLELTDRAAPAQRFGLPVLSIGGEWTDPSDSLRGLLGAERGWLLVRPDAHVACALTSLEGLAEVAGWALGEVGLRGLTAGFAPRPVGP